MSGVLLLLGILILMSEKGFFSEIKMIFAPFIFSCALSMVVIEQEGKIIFAILYPILGVGFYFFYKWIQSKKNKNENINN